MATTHIIRVPFETSNNKGSSKTQTPDLLLSISSQAKHTSTGSLPDLTLQGTEGSVVVAGNIYSSRLIKILASDADISLQDFEQTLRRLLLPRPLESTTEEQDGRDMGVSVVAAWTNDSASRQTGIRLRFRRIIGGIVRYIGEVPLRCDDSLEVDVLEWARVAVTRGMQLEAENVRVRARLAEVEEGLVQMQAQMEEFVRVKRQDEEVLMGCFVKVLNEKKAKIRELQGATTTSRLPWPEVPEEEEEKEEEVKEEDVASVAGRRGGKGRGRARGRGAARGAASQRGRKRKQDDVRTEASPMLGSSPIGEDAEMREDGDEETDRESRERSNEAAETDGDIDMSADSDDLDAPSRSQLVETQSRQTRDKASQGNAAKAANSRTAPSKHKPSSKQHAIRARKPSPTGSEDGGTTDDEL